MIYIAGNSGYSAYGVQKFILDTPDDIINLKTTCEPGSTAFIISSSETYMLNNQKRWIKVTIASSSGGGGGGEIDPQNTYVYNGGIVS